MRAPQFVHTLWRLSWRITRPRTRGVKVMVFDGQGRVLLIRNAYGDTTAWVLPGGGLNHAETPETGAQREVMEETGCTLSDLSPLAEFHSSKEGKRDTVFLFRALASEAPHSQPGEVAEAAFFPLDRLPPKVSPATLRRLTEVRDSLPHPPQW